MKLSEMTTVQLSNAIADLAEPLANIAEDKELASRLSEYRKFFIETGETDKDGSTSGTKIIQLAANLIRNIFPISMKTHCNDTIAIIAALTGKTKKQVAQQKGLQTIKDLTESIDKDLIDFFRSSVSTDSEKS